MSERLIGVISDTHGRLPPRVHELFAGTESIIHAGDVGRRDVLLELEAIAPVHAVAGNVDGPEFDDLPGRAVIEIAPLRIGVTHGHLHGGPFDRHARLRQAFTETPVDIIIYGHTHRPCLDTERKPWVLNPGSASQGRGHGCSVGLLRLRDGQADFEIMPLD